MNPDPTVGRRCHHRPVTAAGKTPGVFDASRRALTVGLVLTITLVGFEALAVATVLPVVERDLGDLSLYGWVFSSYLLASLVGTVVAGRETDRHGPAMPFAAGCALFAAGLIAGGLAPTMPLLVLARVVQGLGAGVVPAVAYASIGRCYEPELRPRMFAVLSTAWVVPGLAGPALAAVIADTIGWRWVFLGLLPLVALAAAITLPALRAVLPVGRADADAGDAGPAPARTGDAVLVALGASLVVGGFTASGFPPLVPVLVGLGVLIGMRPFRRLVPPGTLVARPGLPAAVLTRGVLTFTYFGTDAFIPLAIQNVRDRSVAYTGVVLTLSTLSWTAAAWVQERRVQRYGPRAFIRFGFVLIVAGIAGVAATLSPSVPVWTVAVSWSIASFGMGCAFAPLSLVTLDHADPGREGAASGSLQLSDQLGFALGTGIGGACVALGEGVGWLESSSLLLAASITGVTGLAGALLAGRLPTGLRHGGRARAEAAELPPVDLPPAEALPYPHSPVRRPPRRPGRRER
jgi:MFS family permease